MSDLYNKVNDVHIKPKAQEEDKYFKVFKHLESVNLRNKAAFDELLRYTYKNVQTTNNANPPKDEL